MLAMASSFGLLLSVSVVLIYVQTASAANCTVDQDDQSVFNMITKQEQEAIWIEGGFVRAGDQEWVSFATILDTFVNAAVFVSLPEIPGETSNEGYPAIARIRNVVSTGQVSFDVRLYQANDTSCRKNWTIPVAIDPPVSLSWMAVERGAYNLSGAVFMIGDGEITRAIAAPYNTSNRHEFTFPPGCHAHDPTKPCEYNTGSDVGIIMQLQTTVNERLLISRVFSSNGISLNNSVTLVLQTHDSPDRTYYEVANAEELAFMTYMNDLDISCVERLSFETTKYDGVTHFKKEVTFVNTYTLPPGIYGTIATARSLADSTGLRAFGRTVNSAKFITQEDQCFDEETQHTTGELVYTFVVGERLEVGCIVCKAVFTPDTSEPTPSPTSRPSSVPSTAPSTVCQDTIEVVRMRRRG